MMGCIGASKSGIFFKAKLFVKAKIELLLQDPFGPLTLWVPCLEEARQDIL
jgi:hypothetical protein